MGRPGGLAAGLEVITSLDAGIGQVHCDWIRGSKISTQSGNTSSRWPPHYALQPQFSPDFQRKPKVLMAACVSSWNSPKSGSYSLISSSWDTRFTVWCTNQWPVLSPQTVAGQRWAVWTERLAFLDGRGGHWVVLNREVGSSLGRRHSGETVQALSGGGGIWKQDSWGCGVATEALPVLPDTWLWGPADIRPSEFLNLGLLSGPIFNFLRQCFSV